MNNKELQNWLDGYSLDTWPKRPPLVMGILNITPDSFSDGGLYLDEKAALNQAMKMVEEGADIIDIGGESTRPGAEKVDVSEELRRVVPVVRLLNNELDICLSVDTNKARVMEKVVEAGAGMINDIMALAGEKSLEVAATLQVPVCLMHMKGNPLTMQQHPVDDSQVIEAINRFFTERLEVCLAAGLKPARLVLDPGFGFGKSVTGNLRIINELDRFLHHGLPIMLGVSRKSTLGILLNQPVNDRLAGSLAATVMAMLKGVSVIRTHDVAATRQALQTVWAIRTVDRKHEEEGIE